MTPERVLSIAAGELGTKESPAGSNRVKYNDWFYGREVEGAEYPWCMVFVQWCFYMAGIPLPYRTASCSALLGWYRRNLPGRVIEAARDAEPDKGDIVIYSFGHTGIVASAEGDTLTAIEGNTSAGNDSNGGAVMRRTRKKSSVTAYIRPYKEERAEMTGEEIYLKLCGFLDGQAVPGWAKDELNEAIEAGITDGTHPMLPIPRYQAAIMALRAMKKGEEHDKVETF